METVAHQHPETFPSSDKRSEWATVAQEARRIQTSPGVIYLACRAGQLRHARVGGRRDIRLRPEWTDAWLERSSIPVEVS